MTEQKFGTGSVSERVRSVSDKLNELAPLYDLDRMDGLPREELMERLMFERARLEERLQILGQAFPNVFEDVNTYIGLRYQAINPMSPGRSTVLQEIQRIDESYQSGRNRELQPLFVVGLQDRFMLEKISW